MNALKSFSQDLQLLVLDPWLDQEGYALSDEQLRVVSKSWDQSIWEAYLKTLETPLKESQVSTKKFDRISEGIDFSVFEYSDSDSKPVPIGRLQVGLDTLTIRQRQVVELIFFRAKSSREAALLLGLSQSTIRDLKRKGLRKLKTVLEEGDTHSPLIKGEE